MRNGSIELVLVDFDDTLVDTAPRFQNARRALLAHLVEAGFSYEQAHATLYGEIDPAMRQQYGLGPKRMEPAFVATYERLCEVHGRTPDADLGRRLAELGRSCYGPPAVFSGAIDALRRLADAHPTVIYTQSGEMEYQLANIRSAGIIEIVNEARVRVCDRKDAAMFRNTLEHYGVSDPVTAWMIGNSMRSDINPALEAGANAILVDAHDPWEYDDVEPFSDAFHRVSTFPDAVRLLT